MALTIEKVEGGYVASVTPPHGATWTSQPQRADDLIDELLVRGCSRSDIAEALREAAHPLLESEPPSTHDD